MSGDPQEPMDDSDCLNPCPFCGGNASAGFIGGDGDNAGGHYISCDQCDASTGLRFSCGEDARPILAEQWNKRSDIALRIKAEEHDCCAEDLTALRAATNALLHQIDIGDFVDSHGHSAKMLKPAHDLMRTLGGPDTTPTVSPASDKVLQVVAEWALAGHISEKGVTCEAGNAIRNAVQSVEAPPQAEPPKPSPDKASDLDEDSPMWLVNCQIEGLLEGLGASEDHRDVIAFLRAAGLPGDTAARVHLAICCSESKRDAVRAAAQAMLDAYTHHQANLAEGLGAISGPRLGAAAIDLAAALLQGVDKQPTQAP